VDLDRLADLGGSIHGRCLRTHQRLDAIDDPLRGIAKLRARLVCGVSLGDVFGPGVVDQSLGERRGQH